MIVGALKLLLPLTFHTSRGWDFLQLAFHKFRV